MKMNTESNVYTIVYSVVLVVIVAVLLAVVNQGLKSRQEANAQLDQQKQMLVALNQDYNNTDPAALYNSLVRDTLLVSEDGKAANIIRFEVEGQTKYILRLHGQGLWGGIGGYLALNADKNTIYGINFNHESETPGLGGEIVTPKFRNQFVGKHIKDQQGTIRSIAVLKEGKTADEGQEQVDAWAGATITSTGVNDMLLNNLQEYSDFLNKQCCKQVCKCTNCCKNDCTACQCGSAEDEQCCKQGGEQCCKKSDAQCCKQGGEQCCEKKCEETINKED